MPRIAVILLICSLLILSGCGLPDRIINSMERQHSADIELQRTVAFAECAQRGIDIHSRGSEKYNGPDSVAFFSFAIIPCEQISKTAFDEIINQSKLMTEIQSKQNKKQNDFIDIGDGVKIKF